MRSSTVQLRPRAREAATAGAAAGRLLRLFLNSACSCRGSRCAHRAVAPEARAVVFCEVAPGGAQLGEVWRSGRCAAGAGSKGVQQGRAGVQQRGRRLRELHSGTHSSTQTLLSSACAGEWHAASYAWLRVRHTPAGTVSASMRG